MTKARKKRKRQVRPILTYWCTRVLACFLSSSCVTLTVMCQTTDAKEEHITTNEQYRNAVLLTSKSSMPPSCFRVYSVRVVQCACCSTTFTRTEPIRTKVARKPGSRLAALKKELSRFKFLDPVPGHPKEKIECKIKGGEVLSFEHLQAQLERLMKARNPHLKPLAAMGDK